jgi:hypothetical protein
MITSKLSSQSAITMLALSALLLAASCPAVAQPTGGPAVLPTSASPGASNGMAAIDAAARSGKYLFIFFWKTADEQSRTMQRVFEAATGKWAASADAIGIQITDPREKPVVDKFGVDRAPMPLVLALAPNGAVTRGFPLKFTEQQLQEAFVSPRTAECMKGLQDRKLVLLCIQNGKTLFSDVALSAAQDFKADARFTKATEIVTVDPEDPAEAPLLRAFKVDPRTPEAVTVVLAPPGQIVATFTGGLSKYHIIAKVTAAQSGPCAGGKCGPGGCCGPKK